jgi:hypothetical protein
MIIFKQMSWSSRVILSASDILDLLVVISGSINLEYVILFLLIFLSEFLRSLTTYQQYYYLIFSCKVFRGLMKLLIDFKTGLNQGAVLRNKSTGE